MTGAHTEEFLISILECALDAIEEGRREHIYRRDYKSGQKIIYHLARDLEKLDACCPDYPINNEIHYWSVIIDCLETALGNPLAAYKQPEEPICSHKEAHGSEMFAFVVQLEDFTRPIYTKFCLKQQTDGTWYISIDCHP
jgi:hypothetical protein